MDRNQNPGNRNENEDLPGYPHYPADEDILNPGNGLKKVSGDVEDLANSNAISRRMTGEKNASPESTQARNDDDEDVRIVPGTEADVTKEDLVLLGDPDADQDMGEDEEIAGRSRVDTTDLQGDELNEEELDIPEGDEPSETDDALGRGDEENDYYSLGGDRHEDLDEERE